MKTYNETLKNGQVEYWLTPEPKPSDNPLAEYVNEAAMQQWLSTKKVAEFSLNERSRLMEHLCKINGGTYFPGREYSISGLVEICEDGLAYFALAEGPETIEDRIIKNIQNARKDIIENPTDEQYYKGKHDAYLVCLNILKQFGLTSK